MRLNYAQKSAPLFEKLSALSLANKKSSLEKEIKHLVDLRVSQINGCAFCVDMHVKEARIDGERELRLHHVAVWRESPLFNDRERTALEWAELVTKLPPHGISEDQFQAARKHFSEAELADLTFAVIVINSWNRLSVSFAAEPGSADKFYGLDRANLN